MKAVNMTPVKLNYQVDNHKFLNLVANKITAYIKEETGVDVIITNKRDSGSEINISLVNGLPMDNNTKWKIDNAMSKIRTTAALLTLINSQN